MYQSETSHYREILEPYCQGYGLDIGFGGDPITDSAIRMDLPQPYAQTGTATVQLGGDCRLLKWFRSDVLDYVYSSHVLEDFDETQTVAVLAEWLRVLRVGGHLILLLPDQPRYVQYCEDKALSYNDHHSIPHFSLAYVRECLARLSNSEEVAQFPVLGAYSFGLVVKKIVAASPDGLKVAELSRQLEHALQERDALQTRLNRYQRQANFPLRRALRRILRAK